jgi:hypothetical protein
MKTLIGLLLLVGVASANTVPPTVILPNNYKFGFYSTDCPIFVNIYSDNFPQPGLWTVEWWDRSGTFHTAAAPVVTVAGKGNPAVAALMQCAATCASTCPIP